MTEPTLTLDLNCDMGESFGQYVMGQDAEIMPFISSANIACGFHGGDPSVMARTVKLALTHGVAIGAHPGLPDLVGFGRRNMSISPQEAREIMLYQMGALDAFVKAEGGSLHHVKPHGALYNMAATSPTLADAIAQAIAEYNPALILYGLSGSELIEAGSRAGLTTASEVFADRSYQSNGQLTPRNQSGALIESTEEALEQVWQMISQGEVTSTDGKKVSLQADTLCIHGDGAHALDFVRACQSYLEENGVLIQTT